MLTNFVRQYMKQIAVNVNILALTVHMSLMLCHVSKAMLIRATSLGKLDRRLNEGGWTLVNREGHGITPRLRVVVTCCDLGREMTYHNLRRRVVLPALRKHEMNCEEQCALSQETYNKLAGEAKRD